MNNDIRHLSNGDFEVVKTKICFVDECLSDVAHLGMCLKHYTRVSRNGTTKTKINMNPVTWGYMLTLAKVNEDTGCLEWQRGTSNGYGSIAHGGKMVRAHRVSYELNYGQIPKSLFVCHHCDNRLCIEPSHLFAGTQQDNIDDMYKKGRENNVCGEAVPNSKLTEQQVLHIRETYKGRYGECRRLMAKLGVSKDCILSIMNRRTWKHLP